MESFCGVILICYIYKSLLLFFLKYPQDYQQSCSPPTSYHPNTINYEPSNAEWRYYESQKIHSPPTFSNNYPSDQYYSSPAHHTHQRPSHMMFPFQQYNG